MSIFNVLLVILTGCLAQSSGSSEGSKFLRKFCVDEDSSSRCFSLFAKQPVSWLGAFHECSSRGERLAIVDNEHIQQGFQSNFLTGDELADYGNGHAWIAGLRSSKWTWLDGKRLDEVNSLHETSPSPEHLCAVVSPQITEETPSFSVSYSAISCRNGRFPYLCAVHAQDCTSSGRVKVDGKSCLVYQADPASWQEARDSCGKDGGDLVSGPHVEDAMTLLQTMNTTLTIWLGLHVNFWQWVLPDNTTRSIDYTSWDEVLATGVNEKCLHTNLKTASQGHWDDSDCQSAPLYVCESIMQMNNVHTTKTEGNTASPVSSENPTETGTAQIPLAGIWTIVLGVLGYSHLATSL